MRVVCESLGLAIVQRDILLGPAPNHWVRFATNEQTQRALSVTQLPSLFPSVKPLGLLVRAGPRGGCAYGEQVEVGAVALVEPQLVALLLLRDTVKETR